MTPVERIAAALDLALQYGQIDGDHHRLWVIDQMVRVLTGDEYARWVVEAKNGDAGPDTYGWGVGIPP